MEALVAWRDELRASIVVLIAILAVGLVSGLVLTKVGNAPKAVTVPGGSLRLRSVYVNLSSLVHAHPAYAIVSAIDRQVLEGSHLSAGLMKPKSVQLAGLAVLANGRVRARSREEHQKAIVTSADQSLQEWEKTQRDSLEQKKQWLERTGMSVVDSLTRLDAAEINKTAASDRRKAAQWLQYRWLDGRFDEKTLEISRSVLGFKPLGVQERLEVVKNALASNDADFKSRVVKINQSAEQDVESIRMENVGSVRRDVSAYMLSEQRRIDRTSRVARERSARKLVDFGDSIQFVAPTDTVVMGEQKQPAVLLLDSPTGLDAERIRKARSELVQRITVETTEAIKRIAMRQKLLVVFSTTGAKIPDYTLQFCETLKQEVWGTGFSIGDKSGKKYGNNGS